LREDLEKDEIQEILLGSRWLKLFILVANYAEDKVNLDLI
jgi:predicted aspartyl protease